MSRESDGDKSARLERRATRAAERWQRKFPCPPKADEPELHALWVAIENLVAHDEGREPTIEGDQTPRTPRAALVARARSLSPVALTDHGDLLASVKGALSERAAREAMANLNCAGLRASITQEGEGHYWRLEVRL
jgi:hypothetical protein